MSPDAWRLTGLAATALACLALALYGAAHWHGPRPSPGPSAPPDHVGSAACAPCHAREHAAWQESHHARAMARATPRTVRADFGGKEVRWPGGRARMFMRGRDYMVRLPGPGGREEEYAVSHVLGWTPLQQFLVSLPGGRLQCLPLAWDTQRGRWYHLYASDPPRPGEFRHWTGRGQTWNAMCAECHVTGWHKGYDPDTDRYASRWSEDGVGCEACHGPGSAHLDWARLPAAARPADNGLTPPAPDHRAAVERCALCHSRRTLLGDPVPVTADLLDMAVPALPEPDLYFVDGQIHDEVYVYGSFVQSRMYARGVGCADCHDPHSGRLAARGNALCLRCHQAARYHAPAHHFHKLPGQEGEPLRGPDGQVRHGVGSGADCAGCHMPGRLYMGIDYRPDHSIRIPRPDLGLQLGTPDACTRCHQDKDQQWAADWTRKWYGLSRPPHHGEVLAAARGTRPGWGPALRGLIQDSHAPVTVRAAALGLLTADAFAPGGPSGGPARAFPPDAAARDQGNLPAPAWPVEHPAASSAAGLLEQVLASPWSLLRQQGLGALPVAGPDAALGLGPPLLADPVLGVRMAAARLLVQAPPERLPPRWRQALDRAVAETEAALAYSADLPMTRLNLGGFAAHRGRTGEAMAHYRAALGLDPDLHAARLNLAVLLSRQGRNQEAEAELRAVLRQAPQHARAHYSLGLLLAERGRYGEAVEHLRAGARGMPDNPRAWANLGRMLEFLGRRAEARAALERAAALSGNAP